MRETSFPMMVRIFILFLIPVLYLLCLTGIASASQITVDSLVWGVWDVDTVLVIGDIRIPPDNDLTIQPGVKVLFDGPWKFQVQQDAKIVAVGSPTQRIVFKPLHDGDTWRGIRMELCCGLSILDYCDFKHAAVAGIGDSASGGAIYLRKSSLAMYHCTFDSCSATNGGAIACTENSSPLITDGLFLRNSASLGGAIHVTDSSSPLIQSCAFTSNKAELMGSAICSEYASPTISQNTVAYGNGNIAGILIIGPDTTVHVENNVITYDSSDATILVSDIGPWSAEIRRNRIHHNVGIAVLADGASPVIEGNTITHNGAGLDLYHSIAFVSCNVIRSNKGYGINVSDDRSISPTGPTIRRNLIDSNGGGGLEAIMSRAIIEDNWITRNRATWIGGVRLDFCGCTFRHNTIAGNISDSMAGGIANFHGGAHLSHCIVYGNLPETLQVLNYYLDWNLAADSCDIQGGWSSAYSTGNIDIDPQFRDTASGDFHAMSDAITTKPLPTCGNEIPDSMEIWINPNATGIDDDQPTTLPADFVLSQNYPNPFNPSTTIAVSLPYRSHVRLEIFNTLGQLVRTLRNGMLPAGATHVVWDSRDGGGEVVSSGVYYYRLTADGRTLTRKMLLLK